MSSRPALLAIGILFASITHPSQAAKIYDWDFTTEIVVDSVNSVTAILRDGAGLSTAGYTFTSDADKGITVVQPAGVAVTDTYTIVLTFSLEDDSPSYQKIIDYEDYDEDFGFYARRDSFIFYDYDETDLDRDDFDPDEELTVIISRNGSTKTIFATVNGVRIWSFKDSFDLGIFVGTDSVMHFFQDDSNGTENPAGTVKTIQVYNRALTDPVVLAATKKKCARLAKKLKKAKETKVKTRIAKARKKLKKCKKQLAVLRTTASLGTL